MSNSDFQGHIGRTVKDSTPWWPPVARPKAGAPNVVIVVFDDVGFAHFNNYGSTIATPNLDRLARGGLRFSNFHTTALCSPTRACLLTGRNHHAVGMRAISNFDTGFPNMRGAMPRSAATLAEVLREQGFGTYMVGKWHLAPMHETSPTGPFHNWPLAKGFDRFYGFLQGETDQFRPELVHDQHYIAPPATPEQGYHVTEDLVDQAINYLHDHVSSAPDRPFFTYLAFGACHSPHQAPADYLAKYRGQFDEGWDAIRARWFERQKTLGIVPADTVLPPRNPGVKAWDDLTDNERRFAARLQEAFAAFLEHTDAHLGRYIDALARLGQLDNTLFIAMSDNGASQEGGPTGVLDEMRYFNGLRENVDEAVKRLDTIGGPDSHTNYPWGWAMAGNTPLKRYKQNTHAGGVRDPLIVHWPAQIKEGGAIRSQFHHVTDIAPTILEILEIAAPKAHHGVEQMAMHGTSMAYALRAGAAELPTRKKRQYFEMFGHRAIWSEGWKAVCYHEIGDDFDTETWELYHADADASEAHDLATRHPEKLKSLIDLWWQEAEAYGVLPLDDRRGGQLFKTAQFRGNTARRTRFVYYPPVSRQSADVAPPTGNRPFTITADFEKHGANGAILARGSANGGYVLYVKDDRLVFDYNFFHHHSQVRSTERLPNKRCTAGVRIERNGKAGTATLLVDSRECGRIEIPEMAVMVSSTGMDVGQSIAPVCSDYAPPFTFEGVLHSVTVEVAASRAPEARKEALATERVTQGLQ
ncbi:MAG: sulfatase-like hydrolase/transferase [Alphaproteobacteria bacterium]|nr:sulfatase-like hydrolase/transferase [Alphaproteobacteria bacterium]